MKLFKLHTHQKSFSADDLILNPKEHPDARLRDVVEIYHPEDEDAGRLLLQITGFNEELKGREIISVESSIAAAFQLRTYSDVVMRMVDPAAVRLDSVEITFRDQYMGRSEMWRLKKHITDTCVYLNKKIEHCTGALRCQVYEMWSQGDRVTCGVITADTKVVFRSSTSMVYLFIQMSAEMWDFDIHGDLYFEKAVNGFLSDLFGKWRRMGCNHEVTVVLFSRTFYAARTLDEFPAYMRDCLQQDYRGRFYEDFYRVAIQNERNDDWATMLVQLRRLFTTYQATVLRYHERAAAVAAGQQPPLPAATNSTAAQGNFLEVLNISLNVFEKHYLDRSFDRTGQLSVVITPGVGVFEVDRELTNITKQRIIDNGVGSDLVCVGEQPLHAVPLLKFHNKDASAAAVDDYSMPHWINLSFYSTNKKVAYSTFIPRIKLPPLVAPEGEEAAEEGSGENRTEQSEAKSRLLGKSAVAAQQPAAPTTAPDCLHNTLFDYDAYDAQIFAVPPPAHATAAAGGGLLHHRSLASCVQQQRQKKTSVPNIDAGFGAAASSAADWHDLNRTLPVGIGNGGGAGRQSTDSTFGLSASMSSAAALRRKMSDPDIHHGCGFNLFAGSGMSPGNAAAASISESMSHLERHATTAASSASAAFVRPTRALINPFAPSHVTIKLTSNRRRWTHIFPKGPSGALIQQHHYQANGSCGTNGSDGNDASGGDRQLIGAGLEASGWLSGMPDTMSMDCVDGGGGGGEAFSAYYSSHGGYSNEGGRRRVHQAPPAQQHTLHSVAGGPLVTVTPARSLTLLWGATGEQEWTPAMTTGVDWKSLTIPACLPITTDYFPDKRSLHNDYLVSEYTLLPDVVNKDYAQQRAIYRRPLSTEEVFAELISQRLAQGFQLIVLPEPQLRKPVASPSHTPLPSGGGAGAMLQKPTAFPSMMSMAHSLPKSCGLPLGMSSTPMRAHQTTSSLSTVSALPLLLHATQVAQERQQRREFLLSIGRIFHKITLVDSEITVTRFRPRHPYPPINIDYRYRFKAPQHDTYEVSGVHFATEKLENFNWNYMDQYICTRGDTDYPLLEQLKYWRFRMYLLPKDHAATKRIIEPPTAQTPAANGADAASTTTAAANTQNGYCDIYADVAEANGGAQQQRQHLEDFVRFLEIHMNKIKKLNCHKLARGSPTTQQQQQQSSHLVRRRHSTSFITRPPAQPHVSSSLSRQHERPSPAVGGGHHSNGGTPVRSGSKVEKGGPFRVSPGSNTSNDSSTGATGPLESNLLMTSEDNEETFITEAKLGPNATLLEIFEAMRHPVTGVCFVARAQSLPSHTFVLWDAITWIGAHVEGAVNALEKLEAMRVANYICHASGDCGRPVRPGFFLYYVCHPDTRAHADYSPPLGDLQTFENEWMEVEMPMPPPTNPCTTTATATCDADAEAAVPRFLRDTIDSHHHDGPIYKQAHLEIDAQQKSDRIEWGHVRYHRQMRTTQAFEIVTQWLTASGPIVYDLVYVWMRKAQQCGFQLVPVPADPLAEPFTDKSDPLRGPIFVPLNVAVLETRADQGVGLFGEFRRETWPDRLVALQEAIVQRFGFVGCAAESRTGSNETTFDRQYVHCSGNMFVLVASPHEGLKQRQRLASGGSTMKKPAFLLKRALQTTVATPGAAGPMPVADTYVTRHVNVKNKEEFDAPRKIGFLWSWNHMIANRKWKSLVLTNSPDAELFQLRMLQDFRDFCANRDDRLVRFWEDSWAAKEAVSQSRNAV